LLVEAWFFSHYVFCKFSEILSKVSWISLVDRGPMLNEFLI
jgi:hypothetical protein